MFVPALPAKANWPSFYQSEWRKSVRTECPFESLPVKPAFEGRNKQKAQYAINLGANYARHQFMSR
jgi:hypothetical protein